MQKMKDYLYTNENLIIFLKRKFPGIISEQIINKIKKSWENKETKVDESLIKIFEKRTEKKEVSEIPFEGFREIELNKWIAI